MKGIKHRSVTAAGSVTDFQGNWDAGNLWGNTWEQFNLVTSPARWKHNQNSAIGPEPAHLPLFLVTWVYNKWAEIADHSTFLGSLEQGSDCAVCPAPYSADTSIPKPAVIPRSEISISCPPPGQGKPGLDRNHRTGSLLTSPGAGLGWAGLAAGWVRPFQASSCSHWSGGLGLSPKVDYICSFVFTGCLWLVSMYDGCGIGWYFQFMIRCTPLRNHKKLLSYFSPSSLEVVISNCFRSDAR